MLAGLYFSTRRFLPHWPDAGRDMSRPGPLPDTATWASPRAEDASDGRDSVSDHGAGAPADMVARPGHTDVHNFLGTGEGADSLHPREQDGAAPGAARGPDR